MLSPKPPGTSVITMAPQITSSNAAKNHFLDGARGLQKSNHLLVTPEIESGKLYIINYAGAMSRQRAEPCLFRAWHRRRQPRIPSATTGTGRKQDVSRE